MRVKRFIFGATGSFALGLALAACGATAGSSGATSSAAHSSSSALIHTASVKVGSATETVLKNQKGLTLYYFTADSPTTSACTGGCASVWPPLVASSGTPTADPALPGTLSVIAGTNQVEYNGHPLYTYSKDGDSGDAYGQGIAGKWFVATPTVAAAAASVTPSSYSAAY